MGQPAWVVLAALLFAAGFWLVVRWSGRRLQTGALSPRERVSLLVGTLGLAVFLLLWVALAAQWGLAVPDAIVARWGRSLASPQVVAAMEVVRVVGSIVVLGPLVVVAVLWLAWRRRPGVLVLVLVAAAEELAVNGLKALIGRPRPLDPLSIATGASFPSGHATAAAILGFLAVWATAANPGSLRRGLRRTVLALAVAWVFLVDASRIILGVHYLSDVVAGTGLGLAIAGGVCAAPGLRRSLRRDPERSGQRRP